MGLEDIFENTDEACMSLATKAARGYQWLTGKHKNILVSDLYYGAGTSLLTSAGLWYEMGYLTSLPACYVSLGDFFRGHRWRQKLEPVELVEGWAKPEGVDEIQMYAPFIITMDGLMFLSSIAFVSASIYLNDRKLLRHSISICAISISLTSTMMAYYISRADIEPPSGKSVFARLGERIAELMPEQGIRNPMPQPVTGF